MNIDFSCQKCEGAFELDLQDLVDATEKLECPHCNAKATTTQTEDLANALTEVQTQLAALAKKFSVSVTIETDDLEEVDDAPEDEDDVEEEEDDLDEDDEDDDEDADLDDEPDDD